jgi:hypothetical protein
MKGLGEKPLDASLFLETILNYDKTSPDTRIVLSDSDPDANQSVHCDVF